MQLAKYDFGALTKEVFNNLKEGDLIRFRINGYFEYTEARIVIGNCGDIGYVDVNQKNDGYTDKERLALGFYGDLWRWTYAEFEVRKAK